MPESGEAGDAKNIVKSLERGVVVLSFLVEQGGSCGLDDIASATSLKKTTAHRILNTLADVGFVERDGNSRRYKVGRRIVALGLAAYSQFEVSKVAVPVLHSLRELLNETTNLTVLEGTDIVIVERFPSSHLLNLVLTVGSRLPAYCTATGKIMLAFAPTDRRDLLISRIEFRKKTPYTSTSARDFLERLEMARRLGFAVCDQEFEVGQVGFAAPIFDHQGTCIAGINVSFPLARHPDVNEHRLFIDHIRQAGKTISRGLGYLGPWPGEGQSPLPPGNTKSEFKKSKRSNRKARR